MGVIRLIPLIAGIGLMSVIWSSAFSTENYQIGVLAYLGKQETVKRWQETAQYLSSHIANASFEIVPLNRDEIEHALNSRQLDFVLTNSGHYVMLESNFGISRLATLKVRQGNQALSQFGAVIIGRADNSTIRNISDLHDRILMAVSSNAFGGFQMAWREMLDQGVNPFTDLKKLEFNGFPHDDIVYEVRDGKVDAGTVRSGTLERMAAKGLIALKDFHILDARYIDNFPFKVSTRLYPEWPLAKTRHTSELLAREVVIALLEMPNDSDAAKNAFSAGWTIPLDYGSVHNLFRQLRIGPYAAVGRPDIASIWSEYRRWILSAFLFLIILTLLMVHIGHVNRRLSSSQRSLRGEVRDRREAQEQLAAHRDSLELRVTERTGELAIANDVLKRSGETLRQLHDITSSIERRTDQKGRDLLQLGMEYFNMDNGAMFEFQDGEPVLTYRLSVGDSVGPCVFQSHFEWLIPILTEQPYWCYVPDRKAHPVWRSIQGDFAVSRLIGVAYHVEGRLAGGLVLCGNNSATEPLSEVDIDILLLVAQWMGSEKERQIANQNLQTHQSQLAHVSRINTMGEMATGLAHELNQPLTAINNYSSGCLRLLSADSLNDEELQNAISSIRGEAERAAKVIRRLREFVVRGELEQEEFFLQDCIDSAANLLKPMLKQNQVKINFDMPDIKTVLIGDRVQIEQVLINLFVNAVDAMKDSSPDRKIIDVSLQDLDGDVKVIVTDHGVGLGGQHSEDIFHPFHTSKKDGMGMGLSISRTIIQAHHGSIIAMPVNDGGARFEIQLPYAQSN